MWYIKMQELSKFSRREIEWFSFDASMDLQRMMASGNTEHFWEAYMWSNHYKYELYCRSLQSEDDALEGEDDEPCGDDLDIGKYVWSDYFDFYDTW